MLTNSQKALIKRAQREAGLSDQEYREALQTVAGVTSSTDPALGNRDVDRIMAYFEAIFFLKQHKGEALQDGCKPNAILIQKGRWAARNLAGQTSRDRYVEGTTSTAIAQLEQKMEALGFGPSYVAAIREKVTNSRTDPKALICYKAALIRTLAAKQRKAEKVEVPF